MEAKVSEIVLGVIVYNVIKYLARDAFGCEVFISLVISNVLILFYEFRNSIIEAVIFWTTILVLSLVLTFLFTDFKIVFIGLILPYKCLIHFKYKS